MIFNNTNLYYRVAINTNLYYRVVKNTNLYYRVAINTNLYYRVVFVLIGVEIIFRRSFYLK